MIPKNVEIMGINICYHRIQAPANVRIQPPPKAVGWNDWLDEAATRRKRRCRIEFKM